MFLDKGNHFAFLAPVYQTFYKRGNGAKPAPNEAHNPNVLQPYPDLALRHGKYNGKIKEKYDYPGQNIGITQPKMPV